MRLSGTRATTCSSDLGPAQTVNQTCQVEQVSADGDEVNIFQELELSAPMETILLVEDSRFLRIATERVLTKAGYRVLCAGDGDEALSLTASSLPDVVVLDMLLPKLSGPEALRALKKNALTAHVPVLVLSSLSQKNEVALLKDGAAAFLEQGPLLENPSLLLKTIKTALTKKAAASGATAAPAKANS
jgi:twitching motility two-component system response regulator PilH